EGRRISRTELLERLAARRHVALGETHDNADHHRLQAELIESLTERRAAVVFEMIEAERSAVAADALRQGVDALARAVDWASSGWPEFEIYAPVFLATRSAELELRGAG